MDTQGWPTYHFAATDIAAQPFTCWNCGKEQVTAKGYSGQRRGQNRQNPVHICICGFCHAPTLYDEATREQVPGTRFGNAVDHISDAQVLQLYEEARSCTASNSYTAAVLCCRKLLMHIAVDRGAKEGLKFVQYVNYLCENHYAPPNSKEWVEHIKDKGNEANHEIKIMDMSDAETLLSFCEMLLKFIYEFPARVKPKPSQQPK